MDIVNGYVRLRSCPSSQHLMLLTFILILGCWIPAKATTLQMAWLAPNLVMPHSNASSSFGAVMYAMETIANDTSLLPGYDLKMTWRDSRCSKAGGLAASFDALINTQADVIFGPPCSDAMESAALFAAFPRVPIFGWLSQNAELSDRDIYSTLVRLLGPMSGVGLGLILVVNHFNWKEFAMLSYSGDDYHELAIDLDSLVSARSNKGYAISGWRSELDESLFQDHSTRNAYLEDLKKHARIIVLIGPLYVLRPWMLSAYDAGMTDGEYVFIFISDSLLTEDVYNFITYDLFEAGDGRAEDVKQACQSLLMMFIKTNTFDQINAYFENFHEAALRSNWTDILGFEPTEPDMFTLFLYDAIITYAKLVDETGTTDNGTLLLDTIKGRLFKGGASGDILMDDHGDRLPDFWVMDMNATGYFDLTGHTTTTINGSLITRVLVFDQEVIWGDGTSGEENAPPDIPACGFSNELCDSFPFVSVLAPVLIVIIVFIIIFTIYRIQLRKKYLATVWKINYEDLNFLSSRAAKYQSQRVLSALDSRGTLNSELGQQMSTNVASYKGSLVAVQTLRKTKIRLGESVLNDLITASEVKHVNVTSFVGATVEEPQICLIWEYCTKGSLQDILWNDGIGLDDLFKFSITVDISKGLRYLHHSPVHVHSRLTSSNVLIDGRWTAKLTDFGLEQFRMGELPDSQLTDHSRYESLFWTAPELLLDKGQLPATQAGNIYSFGVIIKEIFCRNGPYTEYDHLEPIDILRKIREETPHFHPELSSSNLSRDVRQIIEACFTPASSRSNIHNVFKQLVKANPFKKGNVMDNMVAMLERYSGHLEEVVAERTTQLVEEKKKTETLLYRMLPKSVADSLKVGKDVMAESFDSVTIYFSDIVRFTDLAAESTPLEVVALLNALYTLFDATIARHDVYKVETIGDAYMLVSGLPIRNGNRHVTEIVNCSMDLLSAVLGFKVPHRPDHQLNIRIGVHTGSCVAGVVGLTMPRYCLFGDTVNTASRMESNGLAQRIHLSPTAYEALCQFPGYYLAARGGMEIKGKGRMFTYWVLGRDGFDKPYPDFDLISRGDNPMPVRMAPTLGKPIEPTNTMDMQQDLHLTDL